MTTLYIGIGHGIMPSGVYDPGAVHGGLVEHHLARLTVEAMVAALERSGFHDFIAEHSTDDHPSDPDYRGSVIRANAAKARYAIEVHWNAGGGGGGHGTETLCYADAGATGAWAHRVQAALDAAVGITNRGVKERTDLWFLRGTNGHALIPEVAFVDGDHDWITRHPEVCRNAGEALARATLAQLGHRYVPPGARPFVVTSGAGGHGTAWPNVDAALADAKHRLVTGSAVVEIRR